MSKKNLPEPHYRADPTRATILKAARKLFVRQGYAGTSMGKIAEKAKVNHSLIFHHFGNKDGLWRAVKQSIVDEANLKSPVLPSTDKPFVKFLTELITQSILFYRQNPDIIRMINWQRLSYEQQPAIGVNLSNESKAWLAAFKYYQEEGEINSALRPEFIMSLILAITSSTALDQNIFIKEDNDRKSYIKFCVERILVALS